jgi:hypothetical protein
MDKPKKRMVKKTVNGKTTTVTLKPSSIKEAFRKGGIKKFGKGGINDEEEKPKSPSNNSNTSTSSSGKSANELGSMTGKQYRQEKRGVKRQAKLDRIKSGKQGDRVDSIINAVGAGAEAVANVTDAVNSVRTGLKKNGGTAKSTYKTGGMVNSNKKVTATKVAKGRPAKSAEPKSASRKATGRVGGTSKAPKTAKPRK